MPDLKYTRWTHLPDDAPSRAGLEISCCVCGASSGFCEVTGEPAALRAYFADTANDPYRG